MSYCIQLGREMPLPLGYTITFAPWEGKYNLTATLHGQAVNIPFKQELGWQETSYPALSLEIPKQPRAERWEVRAAPYTTHAL